MRFSIFTSDKCPSKLWVTRSSYDISSTYLEIRSALNKFIKFQQFSREDLRFRITVGKLHFQTELLVLTDLSTRLSAPSRSPPAVT